MQTLLFKHFVLFISFLALITVSPAARAQKLKTQINRLITATLQDPNGPGGVFLVAHKGKVVFEKAYGQANVELNSPLSTDHVFQLGSITKQFTAVAVLMLAEQGKLGINDSLAKYIPDFPNGDSIRIYHLLTHTSGIKDFTAMKTLKNIAQKDMSPREMVDFFKDEPVGFLPGEKFEYNNSGYVVLGYLIELVSGQSYQDFIAQQLFAKAGMRHSRYATDRQLVPNRAYGYQKKDQVYVNKTVINFSVPFAAGALMSTAADMLKWQQALNNNTLLSAASTRQVFAKHRLNNGTEFGYGYGWHIRDINGVTSYEHGGSIFGFKTMGVYMPDEDIYVIGLTNCDCNSPTQLVQDIAKLVLRAKTQP